MAFCVLSEGHFHYAIYDTFKTFRMQQECWTIDSLDTYKPTRRMTAIYNANCQDKKKAIEIFCKEAGYTQKKAEEYLSEAIGIRARQTEVIIDWDDKKKRCFRRGNTFLFWIISVSSVKS